MELNLAASTTGTYVRLAFWHKSRRWDKLPGGCPMGYIVNHGSQVTRIPVYRLYTHAMPPVRFSSVVLCPLTPVAFDRDGLYQPLRACWILQRNGIIGDSFPVRLLKISVQDPPALETTQLRGSFLWLPEKEPGLAISICNTWSSTAAGSPCLIRAHILP